MSLLRANPSLDERLETARRPVSRTSSAEDEEEGKECCRQDSFPRIFHDADRPIRVCAGFPALAPA